MTSTGRSASPMQAGDPSPGILRQRWSSVILSAIVLATQMYSENSVRAQEPATAASAPDYSRLLTSQSRQMFDAIRQYVADHPDSSDSFPAACRVLEIAREQGWEADATGAAALVRSRSADDPANLRLALATEALAAARNEDAAASAAAFKEYVRTLRLRQPNLAADLAQSLALVWQSHGETAAAEAVYEQLTSGFFLNDELRQFADARRQRLKLVGEAAPAVPQTDLVGKSVDWSEMADRVVVLDFWATNCRPCLEEFPRLKQRYAELAPRGVEILGISFDSDAGSVEQFLMQQSLPWRQVLARETAENAYGVHLLPCLMLVSRTGKIAAVDVRPDDLRWAVIQELERPGR